jgi:endonuclease/exonuclease/phosphatase (EEP) superfamily protein YafD
VRPGRAVPASALNRRLHVAARISSWAVTAGMVTAAALRWSGTPTSPALIGLQAMSPWLLTPALPLAAAAGARRHRALAAVALALGVVQVVSLWPDVGQMRAGRAPAGATRLRLVTANMLLDNHEPTQFAARMLQLRPDVLLLQEVTPWNLTDLTKAGLLDAFAYHFLDPLEGAHGSVILSKLPLQNGRTIYLQGWPMSTADVSTDAGPLRVVNVHAVAPLAPKRIELWKGQLADLGREELPAGGHLVLAGDFNATRNNPAFAQILGSELRDAFVQAGTGAGNTWPADLSPLPGLLRIDHVLVSPDVVVTGARRARAPGSDHRPLVADLALVRQAGT